MSDFFTRLAERALGLAQSPQPVLPSRFAARPASVHPVALTQDEGLEEEWPLEQAPLSPPAVAPPIASPETAPLVGVPAIGSPPLSPDPSWQPVATDAEGAESPAPPSLDRYRLADRPLPFHAAPATTMPALPEAQPAPIPELLPELQAAPLSHPAQPHPPTAARSALLPQVPRPSSVPPSIVQLRRAESQGATSRVADQPEGSPWPPTTPIVRISIGRIEVRALSAPAPTPAPVRSPAAPRLSLEDYLRSRRGGSQ